MAKNWERPRHQSITRSRQLFMLRRYGMAFAGPLGGAVAQFILTIQALHLMTPESFGSFSFLLIAQQFSLGLWSALFCAPLPVLLNEQDKGARASTLRCLFVTNLVLTTLAAFLFIILGAVLGVTDATVFGGFAGIALLRWFARAHGYATGVPLRTISSDLIYSVALLASVAVIALSETTVPTAPYAALLVSATLGLLPFGSRYLVQQFIRIAPRDLKGYADVWRHHSRWSLAGVITTEVTGNAHAYLVTLLAGPAAFAPVAVSALVTRPIGVAMNALSEFERPQMARHIWQGEIGAATRLAHACRWMLIGAWAVTAMVAAPVVMLAPHILFSNQYDPSTLAIGAVLWMTVAVVRLLRTPDSTLLQAAGMFRMLAYASIISSGVSVVAVIIMIVACGPLWSIVGVLVGEVTSAILVWRQGQLLQRAMRPPSNQQAPLPERIRTCG